MLWWYQIYSVPFFSLLPCSREPWLCSWMPARTPFHTPEVDNSGKPFLYILFHSVFRQLRGLIIAFYVVQMVVYPFWPKRSRIHAFHAWKQTIIHPSRTTRVACFFQACELHLKGLLSICSNPVRLLHARVSKSLVLRNGRSCPGCRQPLFCSGRRRKTPVHNPYGVAD